MRGGYIPLNINKSAKKKLPKSSTRVESQLYKSNNKKNKRNKNNSYSTTNPSRRPQQRPCPAPVHPHRFFRDRSLRPYKPAAPPRPASRSTTATALSG